MYYMRHPLDSLYTLLIGCWTTGPKFLKHVHHITKSVYYLFGKYNHNNFDVPEINSCQLLPIFVFCASWLTSSLLYKFHICWFWIWFLASSTDKYSSLLWKVKETRWVKLYKYCWGEEDVHAWIAKTILFAFKKELAL